MNTPRVSDRQLALLEHRLAAGGLGRRDFLRIAAGLATMSAVGFNARSVSAARCGTAVPASPPMIPREPMLM